MATKQAFIFPGQGSQAVGMMHVVDELKFMAHQLLPDPAATTEVHHAAS